MTVEVYGQGPPNATDFVIAWLAPLSTAGAVGAKRPEGAVLPYRMVNRVTGTDDGISVDVAVVSVHTFAATDGEAKREADTTQQRMSLLVADPLNDVAMHDNSIANAAWVETVEYPHKQDYADPNIVRYVARYRLGLTFIDL